jgi:hypothetical protein
VATKNFAHRPLPGLAVPGSLLRCRSWGTTSTAPASFPAKIVVPAGNTTATFTVTTSPVSTPTRDAINANDAPNHSSAYDTGVEFTVEP